MKIVSSILTEVLIVDVDRDLEERTKIEMPDAQVSTTYRLFSYINAFMPLYRCEKFIQDCNIVFLD